jgi:hypothetical protein
MRIFVHVLRQQNQPKSKHIILRGIKPLIRESGLSGK